MLRAATLAGPEGRKTVAHGESRGMAVLINDQARISGRQNSALRPIFLSPLRGLLMTLMLYPMALPWATFCRPSA